jgi:hypothetical protein
MVEIGLRKKVTGNQLPSLFHQAFTPSPFDKPIEAIDNEKLAPRPYEQVQKAGCENGQRE